MSSKKLQTLDGLSSDGAVTIANTLNVSSNLQVDTTTLYVDAVNNRVGINQVPTESGVDLIVSGTIKADSFIGNGGQISNVIVTGQDAGTLDGINSTQFLRSDTTDSFTGSGRMTFEGTTSLRLNDNRPLEVGTNPTVSFSGNTSGAFFKGSGNVNFSAGDVNFDSGTLFVDVSADRVGVGKTNPSTALDVNGTVTATAFSGSGASLTNINAVTATTATNSTQLGGVAASGYLRSNATSTLSSTLTVGTSGTLKLADNIPLQFGTGSDSSFSFDGLILNYTGTDISFDSDVLYVDVSANRVGIGTTTPSNKLQVAGGITATAFSGNGSGLTNIAADTATNATNLGGVAASGYLRSNAADTLSSTLTVGTNGNLKLADNRPLQFGDGVDASFSFDGLILNYTGTDISFDGGTLYVDVSTNYVGIGTTTPSNKLQVAGGITATGFAGSGASLTSLNASQLTSGTLPNARLNSDLRGRVTLIGATTADYIYSQATAVSFVFNGVAEARITEAGQLDVDGDIVAYSTAIGSDRRFKKDITTVENALETVNKLRGTKYKLVKDDSTSFGVIAQELEEHIPEMVSEQESLKDDNETYKYVNYNCLHAYFIEAIKELTQKVEELEKRLETNGK